MKKTLFSGVKPTGRLTLGNYIGAIGNWQVMQQEFNSIFCVADLHSLTVEIDPKELNDNSYGVLAAYLACGLDPEKSTIYFQSQLPAHTELCWLLNCVATFGETSRMVAFKEKAAHKDSVSVGLFDYPILMAADILLFDSEVVPIGEDQRQHLELARTLANRFNSKYGKTFVVPEGRYQTIGAKIQNLQNPASKMSKSDDDTSGNIMLEDSPETIRKEIKRAVTDSGDTIVASKDKPGITNLLNIYCALSHMSIKEAEAHFAGKSYGQLKSELADLVVDTLKPVQDRMAQLLSNRAELDEIVRKGAEKVRIQAERKVREVKTKMGLI